MWDKCRVVISQKFCGILTKPQLYHRNISKPSIIDLKYLVINSTFSDLHDFSRFLFNSGINTSDDYSFFPALLP